MRVTVTAARADLVLRSHGGPGLASMGGLSISGEAQAGAVEVTLDPGDLTRVRVHLGGVHVTLEERNGRLVVEGEADVEVQRTSTQPRRVTLVLHRVARDVAAVGVQGEVEVLR